MFEKVFTAMDRAGKYNLIAGICLVVTSILSTVCGAFMIVHGASLLSARKKL